MNGKGELDLVRDAARLIGTVYFMCDELRNRQVACGRLAGTEFRGDAWERMERARSAEGRSRDPGLAQLLDMAACLGMREAALAVQREIGGFFDRHGVELDCLKPEGLLRPALVVNNAGPCEPVRSEAGPRRGQLAATSKPPGAAA